MLQTPIPNSDLILYTDSSACRPSGDKYIAGCVVVNDWVVIEVLALPNGTLAQAAELYAFTNVCILARDKVAILGSRDTWKNVG